MAWGDKGKNIEMEAGRHSAICVFLGLARWIFRRGCGDFGGVP